MPYNLVMVSILLFLLLWGCEIFPATAQQRNSSTITLGSSLSTINNSYWSSGSGLFAFGFYPKGNGFAVGIWYNIQNQDRTIVWTANRDAPPLPSGTILLLSNDGRLILQQNQQAQEQPIVPLSSSASSASLLDNGNFAFYGLNSEIIWQSFDYPTDTILQGQRLLAGHRLVSSISETDQSSGKFQLAMQTDGNLVQYAIDGPDGVNAPFGSYWNSSTYTAGINVSLVLDDGGLLSLLNSSGIHIMNFNAGNSNLPDSENVLFRLKLGADGILRLYSRFLGDENGRWGVVWSPPTGTCDPKGLCGMNEYCNIINQEAVCNCVRGFVPIEPREFGCKRHFSEDICGENVSYAVDEMENVIWEDNPYSILNNVGELEVCRENCSRDCNCEAALYVDQQCRKQKLPLRFGRIKGINDTQSTIALIKTVSGNSQRTTWRKNKDQMVILKILCITFLITTLVVLAISGVIIYKYRVKGYKRVVNQGSTNGLIEDITLRYFAYDDLVKATNGFQDELGKGAFGTVFKGVLPNSQTVIAVKRLEIAVREGEREFENEMRIIGRTHHRNLVKLLGYCHEGSDNRLLVYEFMSNGSLADFLFKSPEEEKPSWEERIGIALDVAKGIRYLHEDCNTQIIHCDIKPENILMDEKGHAKIADFGVAKLMGIYQTRTFTRIRGTRGYVAPEWHRNLPVTVKADVYSFGVMLLEIVCCRRSLNMDIGEDEVVLVNWVYDCFESGEVDKLVRDEGLDKGDLERVVRVGLWCIQDDPAVRPLMKSVVLMLEGTVDIPSLPIPASFSSSI